MAMDIEAGKRVRRTRARRELETGRPTTRQGKIVDLAPLQGAVAVRDQGLGRGGVAMFAGANGQLHAIYL